MEQKATVIKSFVENTEILTKNNIDLSKHKVIQKFTPMLTSVAAILIITIAFLCATAVVNIGAALWIGELVGSAFCGFLIVAAFNLFIVVFLYVYRESLLKMPFNNSIITNIRREINI